MRVNVSELRAACERVFEHLGATGQESFHLDADYYWNIPAEQRYDVSAAPSSLTIGQISDDWDGLRKIAAGKDEPVGYDLVRLAAVLRAMGDKAL
jgi:hypothetical protein